MTDNPPIPAATLIVMRPGSGGAEILVVERAAAMAFAGGAIVFPGGRIDPDDIRLAQQLGRPGDAARISAIRETIEESAVLAGVRTADASHHPIDPALGPLLQAELVAGTAFAALLGAHELELDLDALTLFTRWMPAFKQARRFDTLFFLAPALPGEWHPRPQAGECQSARWTSASALLERIAAGTDHAIFPTKRNLERIARFASIDEARADAERYSLDAIVPWIEERGGEPHVCIPADRGYPCTSEPMTSAVRA